MKKSELMDVYYRMRLARSFETRVAEQYTKGRIGSRVATTNASLRKPQLPSTSRHR